MLALGFSAILVRTADAPGVVSSFYRMAAAIVVMAWPVYRRVRARGYHSRRAVQTALLGGLLFGGDVALWATGITLSGATNPTLLANTAPIWVGLGALLLFHEKLNAAFWAGLALAMGGAAVVLGLDASQATDVGLGSLFGLLAGVFYGGYFLVTQRGRQSLDALTYFWFAALSSLLALGLLIPLRGHSFTGYSLPTYLNFLAQGLLVQACGQLAMNYALGYLPASLVSPTMLGQPVVTALLAVPLLHERFTLWQVIGGAAVLAGVYVVHRSRQRET
jgi:drug/metabolite transporter (DMT)-like permease